MRLLLLTLTLSLFLYHPAAAAEAQPTPPVEELALRIAGDAPTPHEKVQRVVSWLHRELEWSATDYKTRTVQQSLERRAGNCADHARVLQAMLDALKIPHRWVQEINIQPDNPERQESAARMIQEKGLAFSVFGLRHNDHRWLEVSDGPGAREWYPADSSTGVVGTDEWVGVRLGFGERPEVVRDMLVPFVVLAGPNRQEDRTEHYLIEAFDQHYGGRLHTLPSWKRYTAQVKELSHQGAAAFAGTANLHEASGKIQELRRTYLRLESEARKAGIRESGTRKP